MEHDAMRRDTKRSDAMRRDTMRYDGLQRGRATWTWTHGPKNAWNDTNRNGMA